jgi:N-acetylmuramoyl-L-alanine amidase
MAVLAALVVAVAWLVVGRAEAGGGSSSASATGRVADAAVATGMPPTLMTAFPTAGLRGKVVVLDPGHNGGNVAAPDVINRMVDAGGFQKECDTVGAETDAGYPEHAFTWDVANRAAAVLRAYGLTVVLTRSSDTGVGPCVDARARAGAAARADVALSIHADGGPADGSGFHVIAPEPAPDGVNAGILSSSARLAAYLRDAFEAATAEPTSNYVANQAGIVDRDDLGGLNLSTVPKVFIECANMRNAADAARVTDPAWRQRAAEGIADGLMAYLAGHAN